MKRFFPKFVKLLLRVYPLVLLIGVGLAIVAWPRMVFLLKNISTDPANLLPENHPSVQSLLEIRENIDLPARLGVVLESDDPEKTKLLLEDLAQKLRNHPEVREVLVKKPGYEFLDKNKFLYLETEDLKDIRDRIDRKIQQEKLGSLYIDFLDDQDDFNVDFSDLEEKYRSRYSHSNLSPYYVSPNGKIFALYIDAKQNRQELKEEIKFEEHIKRVVESVNIKSYDPSMKLYFNGSSPVREYRVLIKDLKIAGAISAILIFLPLLIRFRRPQFVLLIFSPLLIGVPLGIAVASVWIPRLNVTTSFLFAILGGLGVESGIHLFSRYYEKRKSGLNIEQAILDLFQNQIRPIFTAVAALATTFLLMAFSDFKGFSEFGILSGVGLLSVFVLYFTFFPALLIFAERIKFLKIKERLSDFRGAFQLSPGFVRTCLVIFSLFTVFSVWAIPQVKFEYDTKKIRADRAQDRIAIQKQRLTAGKRVNRPAMVLLDNDEEAEALREAFTQLKKQNPNSTLDNVAYLKSLVPPEQDIKLGTLKEIQGILTGDALKLISEDERENLEQFKKELARPEKFQFSNVPQDLKNLFKVKGQKRIFFIFARPELELDNAKIAMEFGREIKQIKTTEGTYYPSSASVVFANVVQIMLKDSKKVMVLAFLSVSIFVFLDFRNYKKTALIMFSISTGVLWAMGVLYLLGDKINLYNIAMLPAVMGMSVDNSIHFYHRYEELGVGSLKEVLSTTGLAALLASVTNAAGFVGLTFASHGGLHSMGLMAVIGLITTLLSTLVFMPLLLHVREARHSIKMNSGSGAEVSL